MGHFLTDAIKAGQAACDAFSREVRAAGYKSRWDHIDYDKHPALKAARDAHHEAGRVLHDAFERQREAERLHAAGRTRAGNSIC